MLPKVVTSPQKSRVGKRDNMKIRDLLKSTHCFIEVYERKTDSQSADIEDELVAVLSMDNLYDDDEILDYEVYLITIKYLDTLAVIVRL